MDRKIPLPPKGRLVFPKETSAATKYWVGNGKPLPPEPVLGIYEVSFVFETALEKGLDPWEYLAACVEERRENPLVIANLVREA